VFFVVTAVFSFKNRSTWVLCSLRRRAGRHTESEEKNLGKSQTRSSRKWGGRRMLQGGAVHCQRKRTLQNAEYEILRR